MNKHASLCTELRVTLQGRHGGLVSPVTHGQLADAESERHPDRGHDGEDDGVGEEEGDRGAHLW